MSSTISNGFAQAQASPHRDRGLMALLNLMALLGGSALLGCASNPPVQPAATSRSLFDGAVYEGEIAELARPTPGAEIYRASYQGGSGFVSINSVRATVEEMATKHCARNGGSVRPVRETASKPPHVLGNFPRVEWLFECARPIAQGAQAPIDKLGQIERLKKLLDSGALTQQEYEREKTRILGTE
jgi:putative oligomerization/nucleic acid binding protein